MQASASRDVYNLAALQVLLGVIVNVYAAIAHRRFSARFHSGESETHDSRFGEIVAAILAAVGLALVVYLIARA